MIAGLAQQAQLSGQASCPSLAVAREMGDGQVLRRVRPALRQRNQMVERHLFSRNVLTANVADTTVASVDGASIDALNLRCALLAGAATCRVLRPHLGMRFLVFAIALAYAIGMGLTPFPIVRSGLLGVACSPLSVVFDPRRTILDAVCRALLAKRLNVRILVCAISGAYSVAMLVVRSLSNSVLALSVLRCPSLRSRFMARLAVRLTTQSPLRRGVEVVKRLDLAAILATLGRGIIWGGHRNLHSGDRAPATPLDRGLFMPPNYTKNRHISAEFGGMLA